VNYLAKKNAWIGNIKAVGNCWKNEIIDSSMT
jgi:hypothetical protein